MVTDEGAVVVDAVAVPGKSMADAAPGSGSRRPRANVITLFTLIQASGPGLVEGAIAVDPVMRLRRMRFSWRINAR